MYWEDVKELSDDHCDYAPYRLMERAELPNGFLYRETICNPRGDVMSSSITFVPKEGCQG